MKSLVLGLGMLVATVGSAADETQYAQTAGSGSSFRYGWSAESTKKEDNSEVKENWVSIRSGHLTGGIDSKLQKYRLRVNANGSELVGIENQYAKKIQIELGAESKKAAYGLLAVETSIVKPLSLFTGTIHNPGGSQRFVVGPILYWLDSHSMVFFYPKSSKSESVVDNAVVIRNRIRQWPGMVWFDLDASYKSVDAEDKMDGVSPWGYGASVGIWKGYGRVSSTPYFNGNKEVRTAYEVGVDASF